MMGKRVNALLWIGLTGMLLIGTSFVVDVYRAFWGDHTLWWTHQAMRLPVEKTSDVFELYIGGKLLQKHLSERTLLAVDKNGKQYPVVSEDITIRLNNWDKIKSSILATTTMTGFGLGVATALFVIGLARYFAGAKKPSEPGAQADAAKYRTTPPGSGYQEDQ
ncbi:MAG TPA: hypothetical protein PKV86_00665 [Syntrophobacteraceae bacterium]|nr:hypothetical protein [Syntrophobacteraceae bacterium]